MKINDLVSLIRKINDKNGWTFPLNAWEYENNIVPVKLLLIHSEISECVEAFRNDDFDNFKEEIADILIRLFDLISGLEINIEKEILDKLDILKTRKFKHGNKRI